jgi:hypothetical protein
MMIKRTTTIYEIAHDSREKLDDLVEFVAWVNAQCQFADVRFESCKSDFGLVIVEEETGGDRQ